MSPLRIASRHTLLRCAIFSFSMIAAVWYWAIYPIFGQAEAIKSTTIRAADGTLLYQMSIPEAGIAQPISWDRLPISLTQALVAAEDKRFYTHNGVDRLALLRTVWNTIKSGSRVGGGSTIEMQLIKNRYFPKASRSLAQKFRELIAAEYWALTHTKQQTLELYVNTVSLGNGAIGVQAASERYFKKDIHDVTVPEAALLVGIMNAPSRYNPYTNRRQALSRRNTVLERMMAERFITEEQAQEYKQSEPVIWAPVHPIKAPHFVQSVIEEAEKMFPNLETQGLTITTTLQPELQNKVERIIDSRLSQIKNKNVQNAAAILMSPQTGEILAYVGSADYWNQEISGQINMVESVRQPGSALKPFLAFQALKEFAAPNTILADVETRFEGNSSTDESGYYPKNFTSSYHGPVTLRDALGSSLNIPMVSLLEKVGLHQFFSTLRIFGLQYPNPPEHYGKSVILGGAETSLQSLTSAYAELALGAKRVQVKKILSITDADGNRIYQSEPQIHESLYPLNTLRAEQSAYIVADILRDNKARERAFGEANLLQNTKDVAIKSGTTKDFKDNLAFAFSPELTLGVWVGNADNSPMQGITGVTGSVPIAHDLIEAAIPKKATWINPGGLVSKQICLPSGRLVTSICPKYREEIFIQGTEPADLDTWWSLSGTGKLTLTLPPEYAQIAQKTGAQIQENQSPRIISPKDNDSFTLKIGVPETMQTIPFIASTQRPVWSLNGERLKADSPTFIWKPSPGNYVLTLEGSMQTIHFSVR